MNELPLVTEGVKVDDPGIPFEIDLKRFYIPVTVTAKCPTCGEQVERALDDMYLSGPTANQPFLLNMYHDHDFQVKVILRVSLEAAP